MALLLLGGGAALAQSDAAAPASVAPAVVSPAENGGLVDGPRPPSALASIDDEANSQKAGAPATQSNGQINGTVVDPDGAVINGSEVVLYRDSTSEARRATTDSDGRFHFSGVPAGRFRLNVTSQGLAPQSIIGVLHAGENYATPTIRMSLTVSTSVQVIASQEELAEAEIKVEEQQRLAGFLPNFFVAYDWHAAPLTTHQKFELAWKNATDPANFIVSGFVAGVQQANNTFSGYGQGAQGYGKRFGAATADLWSGTFMGGAVFPTLFKQDPRYFYKGTGTVKERLYYALSRSVICRGDNGKWQPAYASVLGDLSAGAISNLYYPPANRQGAGLTFEEGALNIAGDAVGNVVQEFLFRHLTPHAPNYELSKKP